MYLHLDLDGRCLDCWRDGFGSASSLGCCGRTEKTLLAGASGWIGWVDSHGEGGGGRCCGRRLPADLDLVRRMELKTLDLEGRRMVDGSVARRGRDAGRRRLDKDGAGRMRCRWWMKETRWVSCGRDDGS
ncbi:hypothetical protein ACLOJK_034783 [Asimina triloba]